jgi:uncharacterized protein
MGVLKLPADDLKPVYEKLETILKKYGSLVVAYSGGVDSALLAFLAWQTLGSSALAVLGVSPSLSQREKEAAIEFLETHRIAFMSIETNELNIKEYQANDPDRCYYCKNELFSRLRRVADSLGFKYVAYGANADDEQDFRPGGKAAEEHGAVAPFIEAGIGKDAIRELARSFSLEVWDKPASPCLASRIPYYQMVDARKLKQIELAENALKDRGFRICRVRHHGELARIELPPADRIKVLEDSVWPELVCKIKEAGFLYVTLDIEGFRSGRLNDAIK